MWCQNELIIEQCTRRKKEGCDSCGTHMKGTPNGMMDSQDNTAPMLEKVEIWAQDIMGIIYYIDHKNNVYQAEDIISNKINSKNYCQVISKQKTYTLFQNLVFRGDCSL